jgi:hypothetical protein
MALVRNHHIRIGFARDVGKACSGGDVRLEVLGTSRMIALTCVP